MLTIYIPTYRRPDSLKSQLASLGLEIAALQVPMSSVKVVVSVNGEHENKETVTWLNSHAKLMPWLRIIVRPYNIGGNANIALGFVEGERDDYLWLLSDNDILPQGALRRILRVLGTNAFPDVLILTNRAFDNLTKVVYDEIADWAQCPLISLGLISRGVYSMQYISSSLESAFLYNSSSFPHLAVLLSSLRSNGDILVYEFGQCNFLEPPRSSLDYIGKYDLSFAGRAQLIPLLPRKARLAYARELLKYGSVDLARSFSTYRHVAICSVAIILAYVPCLLFGIPFYVIHDVYIRAIAKAYR
mgnify:CR=1 FL=1